MNKQTWQIGIVACLIACGAGEDERTVCGPGTYDFEGVCLPVEEGQDGGPEGDADADGDSDADTDSDSDSDADGDADADADSDGDGDADADGDADGECWRPEDCADDFDPCTYTVCRRQVCIYLENGDQDEDGRVAAKCGGDDCNDHDRTISPMAFDTPGDGIDQNCDGFDGPPTDIENTDSTCSDGIDNNKNGSIDCDDNGCWDTFPCMESTEPTCTDGADNDQDGFADCADDNCDRFC